MGKKSVKKNKNIYQICREGLELTREKASELLETISADRIEKIESGKSLPRPDEVIRMSDCYKMPNLCNQFCAKNCPIGQKYVPVISMKELSQITLEILASLNRLIEIVADGKIEEDEYPDFITIQDELEKISLSVEALQLWVEKAINENGIDPEKLKAAKP